MARISAPRRFTLIDAMVLIAATALALTVAKATGWIIIISGPGGWTYNSGLAILPGASFDRLSAALRGWSLLATPFLVSFSFTLTAMSLSRRANGFRRLARRPGIVACWASAFALTIEAFHFTARLASFQEQLTWIDSGERLLLFANEMTSARSLRIWLGGVPNEGIGYTGRQSPLWGRAEGGTLPGFAVLAAWTFLVVSGRFRPEPNWFDRTGRVIGVAWIGIMFVRWSWVWVGY